MSTLEILRDFGWLGLLVIWFLDKFFPSLWSLLTDKILPSRARERAQKLEEEEKNAQVKRESESSILKAKIERELREEEHRRRIEDRMATAQEDTAKNIQQMALAITTNNERLSTLISLAAAHNEFTSEAIGDMRETVVKLHKRDTQRKIKTPRRSTKT